MKLSELKEKSDEELRKLLSELQGQLTKFRFEVSVGEEKNVRKGRGISKDIARIMTLLSTRLESKNNRVTAKNPKSQTPMPNQAPNPNAKIGH